MKILVVVDMQNDFIDGSLGTKDAVAILPKVVDKIKNFNGKVIFTRDTHFENYMETAESEKLPIIHCIKDTEGWQIHDSLTSLKDATTIDKLTFGSIDLAESLKGMDIDSITIIGLCTDICVISNALVLKATFPEIPIEVDESCCAGVTPESHTNAINAMKMCQIDII